LQLRRAGRNQTRLQGVATGLPDLDQALGGLQGLTFLAGDTATGKTSLCLQIAVAGLLADPELGVVYCALDDVSTDDIWDQILCNQARLDHRKLESLEWPPAEQGRIDAANERLSASVRPRMLTLVPSLYSYEGLPYSRLIGASRDLMKAAKVSRVLLVIDLLQNMPVVSAPWDDHPTVTEHVRRALADPDRWRMEQIR
jgi:replicative DNA helicase